MPLTRGQRLRRLREQKGVEIKEAAPIIGISRPYLSLLERDQKGRNVDHLRTTLEKIAKYYGVIPAYLLVDTPQEYICALTEHLGADSSSSFGERLHLVIHELKLRWGDEYTPKWLADAMGTTVAAMEQCLANSIPVTQTTARQIAAITGAPAEWLVGRSEEDESIRRTQHLIQMAIDSGIPHQDLAMLIEVWKATRNVKKPSE